MITGEQLVAFAKDKLNVPYVYGMKGTLMTHKRYNELKKLYGKYVWDSDAKKVGKVCCDCSGLISWATGKMYGSAQLYENAVKREPIATINTAPVGVLVWQKGHVGIYIGNGQYIAEDGSAYGCRINKIAKASFTHWLVMDYINYEEDELLVEKIKVIINGKEEVAEAIFKDGTNYIKIRDIANKMGFEVSSKGNVAVLTAKK